MRRKQIKSMRQTRDNHMAEVQEKILTASKQLFLRQGYRRTTIQQIIESSGVTSGSIYNIYGNKERIFQATADYVIEQAFESVNERFSGESPVFRFAANLSLELLRVADDPIIWEIYYEALTSDYLFERAVQSHIAIETRLLPDAQTPEARACHALIFCGAMRAYLVSLTFENKMDFPCNELQRHLIAMQLTFLGLSDEEKGKILTRLEDSREEFSAICRDILSTGAKEDSPC